MPTRHNKDHNWEKPSDKFARSEQAMPNREPEDQISDSAEDIVLEASEESFPASDPPSYTKGRKDRLTGPKTEEKKGEGA